MRTFQRDEVEKAFSLAIFQNIGIHKRRNQQISQLNCTIYRIGERALLSCHRAVLLGPVPKISAYCFRIFLLSCFIALLWSSLAHSEAVELLNVSYNPPENSSRSSTPLLRHTGRKPQERWLGSDNRTVGAENKRVRLLTAFARMLSLWHWPTT